MILIVASAGLTACTAPAPMAQRAPEVASHATAAAPNPIRSTLLTKTSTTWSGAPIQYPLGPAEVTAVLIEIPSGTDTGWHVHASPNFAYMLEGELEVRLTNGQTRLLRAGDVHSEVVDTVHAGRSIGQGPARLVVFYTSTVGTPLSAPAQPR
jgi:quercetin dioxygenase-like cupin family protein